MTPSRVQSCRDARRRGIIWLEALFACQVVMICIEVLFACQVVMISGACKTCTPICTFKHRRIAIVNPLLCKGLCVLPLLSPPALLSSTSCPSSTYHLARKEDLDAYYKLRRTQLQLRRSLAQDVDDVIHYSRRQSDPLRGIGIWCLSCCLFQQACPA